MVQSMLQDYNEVLMADFFARIDAKRGHKQDGFLYGRILSVRSVYIWPRSSLAVEANIVVGTLAKLINCRSCVEGCHWIRTELAHEAVYKDAPADNNTTT